MASFLSLSVVVGLGAGLLPLTDCLAQHRPAGPRHSIPALLPLARPEVAPAPARPSAVVRPGQEVIYYYNPVQAAWEHPYLRTYTYDAAGRLTRTISGDSLAGPAGTDREELRYDSRGNLTEQLLQLRDTTTVPWENAARVQWTYDEHNRETLILDQEWRNGAWLTVGGYRVTNTYSSAGTLSEELFEQWQPAGYVPSVRRFYVYNASNQPVSTTGQRYRNGTWVNEEQLINMVWYDYSQNYLASYAQQLWDGTAWQTETIARLDYQPNGSYVGYIQYLIGGQWQDFNRFTLRKDFFGTVLEDSWEQQENGQWKLKRSNRSTAYYTPARDALRQRVDESYDEQTSLFVPFEKHSFSTPGPLSGRKAAATERAELYPNPAEATVTLSLTLPATNPSMTVPGVVVNSLGQVVLHFTAQARAGRLVHTLNVAPLAPGIYTVQLRPGTEVLTQRLVRQ